MVLVLVLIFLDLVPRPQYARNITSSRSSRQRFRGSYPLVYLQVPDIPTATTRVAANETSNSRIRDNTILNSFLGKKPSAHTELPQAPICKFLKFELHWLGLFRHGFQLSPWSRNPGGSGGDVWRWSECLHWGISCPCSFRSTFGLSVKWG